MHNHGKHLKYLFIITGSVVAGLLVAGTPIKSLLPFAVALACPLMMVLMMRGMAGHGGGGQGMGGHGPDGCGHDHHEVKADSSTPFSAHPNGTSLRK